MQALQSMGENGVLVVLKMEALALAHVSQDNAKLIRTSKLYRWVTQHWGLEMFCNF
jgi:hypothetical protein